MTMAFSRSIQKGQVPKCCELCETDTKIKWKCLNCDLLMCTKCKDIHIKIKSTNKHKIIDIKEVGQHSKELDFSNINCEDHEGQICFMFCKPCKQIVCPKCIAEIHKGHGLVEISEGHKIQIENVKEIRQQIKSHIEELANQEEIIRLLRTDEKSKYIETRNLIQAQNAALKREVDKYTEKLIKDLDQKWRTLENTMEIEEHTATAMKTIKEDQSKKVDEIITCNDAGRVFKEIKQMGKFIKEAVEPIKLDFSTMPKFITGEITEYNFGSLQDVTKDLVININQQFTTDIGNVFLLSICPDNSLWISDQEVIQRVKPEGSNLKVMSNFNMKVYGMALTPTNDLLITVAKSRLKQISGSSGLVTDSVYSVNPLNIRTVHVTRDYKVIVGAYTPGPAFPATGRRVVIRMSKEGKHEKTYEHDSTKQPIFTNVYCITTTTNGMIFVLDQLSEDSRCRVVVLGQDDVLNTYTGHPMINSDDEPFKPVCVATTPLDNIIVTELNINTLHILNSVGNLITYYDFNNIGILYPYSLSFTTSGQLYIGCTRTKGSTDKAKLYKVDITHT